MRELLAAGADTTLKVSRGLKPASSLAVAAVDQAGAYSASVLEHSVVRLSKGKHAMREGRGEGASLQGRQAWVGLRNTAHGGSVLRALSPVNLCSFSLGQALTRLCKSFMSSIYPSTYHSATWFISCVQNALGGCRTPMVGRQERTSTKRWQHRSRSPSALR